MYFFPWNFPNMPSGFIFFYAEPSLAFSHYPGSMYISDTPIQSQDDSPADIRLITLCEKPYWASLTSEAVVEKIKQLEGFIAEDLGEQIRTS